MSNLSQCLIKAAKNNEARIVERLISRGADVNARFNGSQWTSLHVAVVNNRGNSHFQTIEVLLRNGVDANARTEDGSTALYIATIRGSGAEVVQLLLDFRADPNVPNNFEGVPLIRAVRDNDLEVAQLLLDYGSDVNSCDLRSGETGLHIACRGRNLKTVELLLKNRADLRRSNRKGQSVLADFFLSKIQCEKILRFFLKYTDVNTIAVGRRNVLDFEQPTNVWKTIVEHVAKLHVLELPVDASIRSTISDNDEYHEYFEECTNELTLAKDTKFKNSWISYFNLLVDSKRKLKNYAGNKDLMDDFEDSGNSYELFSIYGTEMRKNVAKSVERREVFEKSSILLSFRVPVFNPNHLIIRDVLDLMVTKDLIKFSMSKK